jgi:hypothetical protein
MKYLAQAHDVLKNPAPHNLERYNEFRYDIIGLDYTVWLMLRVAYLKDPKAPLGAGLRQRLVDHVPGIQHTPYDVVAELLQRIKESGYTTDDDFEDAEAMRKAGYLSGFSQ